MQQGGQGKKGRNNSTKAVRKKSRGNVKAKAKSKAQAKARELENDSPKAEPQPKAKAKARAKAKTAVEIKLIRCRDWAKGECPRGDKCPYAHSGVPGDGA